MVVPMVAHTRSVENPFKSKRLGHRWLDVVARTSPPRSTASFFGWDVPWNQIFLLSFPRFSSGRRGAPGPNKLQNVLLVFTCCARYAHLYPSRLRVCWCSCVYVSCMPKMSHYIICNTMHVRVYVHIHAHAPTEWLPVLTCNLCKSVGWLTWNMFHKSGAWVLQSHCMKFITRKMWSVFMTWDPSRCRLTQHTVHKVALDLGWPYHPRLAVVRLYSHQILLTFFSVCFNEATHALVVQ